MANERLVAAMEPRYNLKSEKHYRTDILDGIAAKVEKKIKALMLTLFCLSRQTVGLGTLKH